jgi:hypothetical protein
MMPVAVCPTLGSGNSAAGLVDSLGDLVKDYGELLPQ